MVKKFAPSNYHGHPSIVQSFKASAWEASDVLFFFSRTSIGGSLTNSVHVHSWNLGGTVYHLIKSFPVCSRSEACTHRKHTYSIVPAISGIDPSHVRTLEISRQTSVGWWMQTKHMCVFRVAIGVPLV